MSGPVGPPRSDLQAAIVASTVYNMQRGKGSRAAKPADFIPKWDRGRRATPEELWQQAMAANAAVGGTITTPKTA